MNRSKMATKELLQLAGADLLGILEPDERERFEQAFLEADPAVQATVQMEQAKAAESLLATVASEDHWRDAPMRAGTSRYWRAACLALVGLSLALTVLYFDARDSVDNLWGLLNRESHRTWETRVIREAGLPFSELQLLPDTVTVRFQDVAGGDLRAALTFNESRGKAFLEARGLSEGSDYELCYVLEEDQQQTFVHRFKNDGQVETFELASVSLPANGHWEIREAGSSEALLLA
jgi:hypothetical protein